MKKFLRVITNKYLLASVAFLAWTVYFDQNDWMTLQQRQKELGVIKDNISYLNTEIDRMNAERTALTTDAYGKLNNPRKMEQYARERYRMKHEGEDVYVIENGYTEK